MPNIIVPLYTIKKYKNEFVWHQCKFGSSRRWLATKSRIIDQSWQSRIRNSH